MFVDTSVWVAAQRDGKGAEATTLRGLLNADEVALAWPVRYELLAGVAKRHRPALKHALGGLPLAIPTEDTWRLIDGWLGPAADAGHRFGLPDLLIAAVANEQGAIVWSLDRDFEAMEKLGFVQRY